MKNDIEIIHMSVPKIYKFEEILFEYHDFFGNIPVNKNYDEINRLPKGFWVTMKKFNKLTDKQKQKFRIQ